VFVIKSRKNGVRDEESCARLILCAGVLLAVAIVSEAQQAKKVYRIGYKRMVCAMRKAGILMSRSKPPIARIRSG